MREIKEVECTDALNSSFKSVFLSSTFEDMKEYRKAIIDRIMNACLKTYLIKCLFR